MARADAARLQAMLQSAAQNDQLAFEKRKEANRHAEELAKLQQKGSQFNWSTGLRIVEDAIGWVRSTFAGGGSKAVDQLIGALTS